MTIDEYIAKIDRKFQYREQLVKPFTTAVLSTVAKQAKRIFSDGIKSNGSDIGQYDTKRPLYINPNESPRAGATRVSQGLHPTQGKHGDHTFKNGKVHKTTYVNNYKDLRNRIGRRIDKVNLTLTNDMFSDLCNAQSPSKAAPDRISDAEYHLKFKRTHNAEKWEGLEKKYGKIGDLTAQEKEAFFKSIDFNFRKYLSEL
ncbi:MAG: hypothetical protein DWQ44_09000 [Bacteroidetes bacterium]|nr:MAG: hypothetical protein DWQ44_09000 [Bacteroidota bacterium]